MKKIDMHTHSSFSDGLYAPQVLIEKALENGLCGLSITDHDNIGAIEPSLRFLEKVQGFFFLPGVEFSTSDPTLGEVHLLGYFPNGSSFHLNSLMNELQEQRRKRFEKIVDCVWKNGYRLSLQDFELKANQSWGRMHVARALVKKGYFESTRFAFDRLLKKGKDCYIPREDVTTMQMISKVLLYGGIPVIAHPVFLYQRKNWILLEKMVKAGLCGIEVNHPMISRDLKEVILRDTSSLNLLYTGGSDFHGDLNRGNIGDYFCSLESLLEFLDNF